MSKLKVLVLYYKKKRKKEIIAYIGEHFRSRGGKLLSGRRPRVEREQSEQAFYEGEVPQRYLPITKFKRNRIFALGEGRQRERRNTKLCLEFQKEREIGSKI